MKKTTSSKTLSQEYKSHWYVWLINIFFLLPAYMALPFCLSIFMANSVSIFWSSIFAICISGFVGTFPLLILNLRLAARKKYYALAVQFVLFDLIGTIFFIVNRVIINA